uniref:Protein-tyrosine-phosphatase n=1 Tax=Arion vulgaris TaxID=1028688 RepID=A0A0B6ZSN1_9EUPU
MLWEQKIDKVVMLTHLVEDGKHKCERYWPEDKKIMFGDIQVKLAATQVFAHYTIRKLRLKKDGDRHNLTHFHFTSWSDKGVPATPWGLIEFEQIVFACPTLKPIVVHCSAGVGRTGTFIGLRNVMIEAKETGCIDFYTTLLNLRKDRMNMIQTSEQYYFLHKAAEVSLLCLNTTVEASDITERINFLKRRVSGMTNLEIEFNSICDACAIDKDEANVSQSDDTEYNNAMILVNKHKNRFNNILPNEVYRPHLNGADDKEGGDYINAVLLPSFTRPDYQILTQLPLPSTVADFWRLVTQYKVSLIVEFEQDLKAKDSTIGDYLPEGENNSLKVDSFIIEARLSASEQYWMQQELLITTNAANKNVETSSSINSVEHRLTYLKCVNTDLDSTKLLALAEKTRSHNSADKGRTLFMCRNGAAYSGLVYVLTLLLDRMDSDNLLTIPLIVGATKVIQPHVIPSVKQYRVLYEVLNQYQESTSVYGNIGNVNQGLSSTQPQKKPREVKKSKNISTESEMFNNDNVYGNSMS